MKQLTQMVLFRREFADSGNDLIRFVANGQTTMEPEEMANLFMVLNNVEYIDVKWNAVLDKYGTGEIERQLLLVFTGEVQHGKIFLLTTYDLKDDASGEPDPEILKIWDDIESVEDSAEQTPKSYKANQLRWTKNVNWEEHNFEDSRHHVAGSVHLNKQTKEWVAGVAQPLTGSGDNESDWIESTTQYKDISDAKKWVEDNVIQTCFDEVVYNTPDGHFVNQKTII